MIKNQGGTKNVKMKKKKQIDLKALKLFYQETYICC